MSNSVSVGAPKLKPIFRDFLYGFDDFGMGVTQNHRAPGADVIDIFFAVGVVEIRALAALEKYRRTADGAKRAHRRIHAAGDVFLRLFE